MHYNSVRNADDYGSGPPAPIRVRSAAELAAASPAALVAAQRSFGEREVARVVAGTGCDDRQRAARVLEQCGGSVDQAIELLIEQLGEEEEQQQQEQEQKQEQDQEQEGGAAPAAAMPEAAAARDAAAAGLGAQGAGQAQQAAGDSGGPECPVAAPAEERRQQQAAAPAAGVEQRLQDGRQGPEGWGRVRLELALDPDDPAGGARVALFPAGPQHAQQDQQEHSMQHAQQACSCPGGAAPTREQDAGAAVCDEQRGSRERPGRKGARLKAKAVSHPGRNKPCPCGSKVKFKDCCARKERRKVSGSQGEAGHNLDAAVAAAAQLKVLLI